MTNTVHFRIRVGLLAIEADIDLPEDFPMSAAMSLIPKIENAIKNAIPADIRPEIKAPAWGIAAEASAQA